MSSEQAGLLGPDLRPLLLVGLRPDLGLGDPAEVVLERRRGGRVVEGLVGGDLEDVAVDQPLPVGDDLGVGVLLGLGGVGLPDRPRVDVPVGERRQRVGGLEVLELDVVVGQAGLVELGEQVVVGRAALGDGDLLALRGPRRT